MALRAWMSGSLAVSWVSSDWEGKARKRWWGRVDWMVAMAV